MSSASDIIAAKAAASRGAASNLIDAELSAIDKPVKELTPHVPAAVQNAMEDILGDDPEDNS
jgi:hypothetical protein